MPRPIALAKNSAGELTLVSAEQHSSPMLFELDDSYRLMPGGDGRVAVVGALVGADLSLDEAAGIGILRPLPEDRTTEWHNSVVERVAEAVLPFIVAILSHDPGNMTATGVLCGGTGILLRTHLRQFIATADHVYTGVFDQGVPVILGDRGKNISSWQLIDRDPGLDIATIEIPSSFDPANISRQFYTRWPPARANNEDAVIVVGFPGLQRLACPGDHLSLGATVVSDLVTESGDRRLILDNSLGERVHGPDGPGPTPGMSGGPAFVSVKGVPVWAGILTNGAKDTSGSLLVSHADLILPDGSIKRGL